MSEVPIQFKDGIKSLLLNENKVIIIIGLHAMQINMVILCLQLANTARFTPVGTVRLVKVMVNKFTSRDCPAQLF